MDPEERNITELRVRLRPGLSEDQVDLILKQIKVIQGVSGVDFV